MAGRPDLTVTGLDVLVRPDPAIPVMKFDGLTIPVPSASVRVESGATHPLAARRTQAACLKSFITGDVTRRSATASNSH